MIACGRSSRSPASCHAPRPFADCDDATVALTALADLGLVLFMFVVGYEVDLGLVRGRERVAASVAIGSIAAPLALGIGLGAWLVARRPSPPLPSAPSSEALRRVHDEVEAMDA